ncbi:MAG: multi-sensor signal transduction histidine kinase, partial [Chthoniobacteraceae bacterium]|nr:multi-sensor signal transduction histidine kinase [Chthoniobacteraceae bacterium]
RWNQNFHVVSGYSREEIARMHPLDFFAGTDQLTVQERIAKVFTLGGSAIEAPFLSKDGRATPYFFTGRHVVFQGKACLVGVGIDISEQKRAESALREAELRFHTLFDQTPVGVVVIDQATALIVECNKQAARQLGYTVQEFSGLDISNIEAVQEETRRRIETLQVEGGIEFETRHRTKAGEIRDVLVSGRMLELAGRKVIHCVFLDMTQRKRAETALHELNTNLENEVTKRTAELQSALVRAEAADRIKSAFLATMSHELRTPLNSIIGFTGILLMGRPGPLNAEQTKQLGMVRNSARHLLALINDVLDISKIEAGQFTVCAEPFDPRVSLEHAVATVQPLADKKSLTLTHALAPELGEMVSDRRRVEQILLNLLNNAIKFTDRGSVTLTAERIANFQSSRDAAPCPAVRICVADTGIGIDSENLATLFQPFRQVDTGLARHAEGTGLGLAISRRLAALLGGEISVASEWSKGSVFTVTLPLQKPSPHESHHPAYRR